MAFFSLGKKFVNPLKIDLHSHLLPGIDDGSQSMEESIKIIRRFKELGYTKLITTPHIMPHAYPNTKSIINQKLYELREVLEKENIDIIIEAAAEHYVDTDFKDLLAKDGVLPFAGKFLLFETEYNSKPLILDDAIFDMQHKGFIPTLAHPERYYYLHNNFENYYRLKEMGVLFQLNIKSFRSKTAPIYKIALRLAKEGLVDFVGSDAHRINDVKEMEFLSHSKMYKMIFEKNRILNMDVL